MALFGSPNHISGRDAQEELFEAIWPGLGADPNPNLHMHRNRCRGKVNDVLIAALVADEICAWSDHESDKRGDEIRVPRKYWDTDRAKFYFYSGEIETGEETGNPDLEGYYKRPWYLLRTDFEQFMRRLQTGGLAQHVWLFDAQYYVAAGAANHAAVMRWDCEIHRTCRQTFAQDAVIEEKYKQKHAELLENALAKLQDAWESGILRPLGRMGGMKGRAEERVPPGLAESCEFLPLGPGEGSQIQPKDAFEAAPNKEWDHVRLLRRDLEMLLPAALIADPMSEPHWTIPQCIAWIATRKPDGVAMATRSEGLRAVAGAMTAAPYTFSSSHEQLLREFRGGLACFAIDRRTGAPDNIPLAQRAHMTFDLEHNAALIRLELRWYDLKFPVDEVLKGWPGPDQAREVNTQAPAVADSHTNGAKSWAPGKVKKWLIEYRHTLRDELPLPALQLRSKCEASLGYPAKTIGKNSFFDLMREVDEDPKLAGLRPIRRGRGKRGQTSGTRG